MTVEDYLSRRTRHLLLDARSAVEVAPQVAVAMAEIMKKDETWIQQQLAAFRQLAAHYIPATTPQLKR
jgi:glycerol-3-phosphate dehydrogenase